MKFDYFSLSLFDGNVSLYFELHMNKTGQLLYITGYTLRISYKVPKAIFDAQSFYFLLWTMKVFGTYSER